MLFKCILYFLKDFIYIHVFRNSIKVCSLYHR